MATEPSLFAPLIEAITLGHGRIRIQLDTKDTAEAFDVSVDALAPARLAFEHPLALRRRSVETRMVAGETEPQPDAMLIRTLAEARTGNQNRLIVRCFALVAQTGSGFLSLTQARSPQPPALTANACP